MAQPKNTKENKLSLQDRFLGYIALLALATGSMYGISTLPTNDKNIVLGGGTLLVLFALSYVVKLTK